MKKIVTLLAFVPAFAFGQSLVGTDPENRSVLLEDFTGIHCGYCPDGHAIAASLEAANPGLVNTVGVHAGVFAVPSGAEPDFRTPEGNALDAHYAISGYPAGVLNRHSFSGAYEQSRGAWAGDVATLLALPSPVNLGVESSYDAGTNTLTVHVQLYYTANSAAGDDRIAVLLTENNIVGWQTDYGPAGNHPNYNHLHVLRDYLTDIWGEAVSTTTAGTWVDRTYIYTVPEEFNIANCDVVAFVGEYQSDVYQASAVPANGGTTLVIGGLTGDPAPYRSGLESVNTVFHNAFTNAMGGTAQFEISFVDTYAPFGWATSFEVNGVQHASSTVVSLANGQQLNVNTKVVPNGQAGVSHYELRIASVDQPAAPVVVHPVHVISGVHDLVVTSPGAEPHEEIYWQGLWGEPAAAKTTRAHFTSFGLSDALDGVLNLYLNVSWTFPSLLDDEVAVLQEFMDNGGNLMIAGQDIGWDQSSASGSYGTPATQSFYSNYMLANFVTDGSSSSNLVNFSDADPIFGGVANSSVANVFANNTYPDQITPIAPAQGILTYNATANIGGLRAQTGDYKLVYFGVGPEQMSNGEVGRQMVSLSHDWFYGTVSVEEFDQAVGALGQVYPNPADASLTIPLQVLKVNATLEVFDGTGRRVQRMNVGTNVNRLQLDTRSLNNGLYTLRLHTADGQGTARSFVVAH